MSLLEKVGSSNVQLPPEKTMNSHVMRLAGTLPHNLVSSIASRDVALWLHTLPSDPVDQQALITFLGLPWRLIVSEEYSQEVFDALGASESASTPMARKRGFVQVFDNDPSRVELPERCLPIYLLNGKQPVGAASGFEGRLRRLTMLDQVRRSGIREILVISGGDIAVPPDLRDLWSSGFRTYLTFVAQAEASYVEISDWLDATGGLIAANLLKAPVREAIAQVNAAYFDTYSDDRINLRVRDRKGEFHKIDVTEADEPERPLLAHYALIEGRDLAPLVPEELTEGDFVRFFQQPDTSWLPYAASLPWIRDPQCKSLLSGLLSRIDGGGAEENRVAYISSEPGAGGTTLMRALAWELARRGYPVLVARTVPFAPDALPIVNYLTRVNHQISATSSYDSGKVAAKENTSLDLIDDATTPRRYEVPWLIVFDSMHWQNRDAELARFLKELKRSGRPACVLVVTDPVLGQSYYNTSIFKEIASLNHSLAEVEARQLGLHLNRFLKIYGKERRDSQWEYFYKEHTVRLLEGTAAFWVTLSFWIQGQYDLTESVQSWMYRSFKQAAIEPAIQEALLAIAALSSERIPLPEILLPASGARWPVSHLLDDMRSSLGPLGLVRVSANGEKYWALVHDILGRFLINALFYDFPLRAALGYADARDAEHLRFLLLRKISSNPVLGERAHRSIGEDFATSIFKIDPDHGHAGFAPFWREVLEALDQMPRSLIDASRAFRHHSAISRRRIAKLDAALYGVDISDKRALLGRAIEDLNYAISFIEYVPGSESNVNLYNSLANAFLDLARVELGANGISDYVLELRRSANEATRRAYSDSPTNSFVIETYIKNLLESANEAPELVAENCIEALGVVFSALSSNEGAYRRSQLGVLGDRALDLLLEQAPSSYDQNEPKSATDVLISAWRCLAEGRVYSSGAGAAELDPGVSARALAILAHPVGVGNMQVLRLTYDLLCAAQPFNFQRQIECVEQLLATDYRVTPQVRVERAILLYQNSRAAEGERDFRSLRQLWRESEHYIEIPDRLRWLRTNDGRQIRQVQAVVGSDNVGRAMARVQEFGNALVPFRPEEHGFQNVRAGQRFVSIVSFGYNGPFLRPVTSAPNKGG